MIVAFEGASGVGKTTASRSLAARIVASGRDVVMLDNLLEYDPLAAAVRGVTHIRSYPLSTEEELLLYSTRLARKAGLVRAALEANPNATVLVDRYIASVLAYSVAVRGLDPALAAAVVELASATTLPDLTVLLHATPPAARSRSRHPVIRGKAEHIYANYDAYCAAFGEILADLGAPFLCIDTTNQTPESVTDQISQRLAEMEA